jgi:hypothetical protein
MNMANNGVAIALISVVPTLSSGGGGIKPLTT